MLDGIALADSEGLITLGYQNWTDYEVETVATNMADSASSRDAAIVFRYNSPNDFYWAGLGLWNGFAGIGKKVGGVTSLLANVGVYTDIVQGQKYRLKVKITGTAISLYVYDTAGTLVSSVSADDSEFPSGGIGFRLYGSHSTFDYIDARAPTSPIPLWLPFAFIGIGTVVYLGVKK